MLLVFFMLHLYSINEWTLFPWLPILPTPISVINKAIEEDRFDIPEVPMEED